MAENIAFSDWSEKLDTAGTNHWLPAYGLQQPPMAIVGNSHQQNDSTFDSGPHDHTDYFGDNNDDDLCDNGDEDNWSSFNQNNYNGNLVRSTSYIYLETILEETSDDLRTDSERSSEEDFIREENWSVKNRDPFNLFNSSDNNKTGLRMYDNNDPGVHDDDDNDTVFYRDDLQDHHVWTTSGLTNGCGGSGSLLQFESLEKQCEQTVFRTTATAAPFMSNSAESLNSNRLTTGVSRRHNMKYLSAIAGVDDECNTIDEDETMLCSTPFSSYAGDGSSSVKSLSKSVESVHSAASRKRYNNKDNMNDVSQSLEDLRRCRDDGLQYDSTTTTVACTAQPAAGMYKTVDCLIDPAYRKTSVDDETDDKKPEDIIQVVGCKQQQQQQRSSENLSEDSGFGDQVPRGPAVQTYKPIVEDENYFEMSTKSIVTIAAALAPVICGVTEKGTENDSGGGGGDDDDDDGNDADDEVKSKFSTAWHGYPDLGDRPSVTTESPTTDDDDDDHHRRHQHHLHHLDGMMASRLPMSSTPNLCAEGLLAESGGDYMRSKKLLDSTVSLDRSHSLKRIHYESESALSIASSRGSNLLITTSFVSLAAAPTPNKGVHFCPVVSEVNWRESFSSSSCTDIGDNGSDEPLETEDDDDYDRVSDEVDENIDTMVMKLLTSLPSETKRPSVAEKQQLRERLDFITGGSPPMSHRICAAPTNATATGSAVPPVGGENSRNTRSVQLRPAEVETPAVAMSSKSKSIGGKLGGFFQRFSLRRLSGRRNKNKKKQKVEEVGDVTFTARVATMAAPSSNNCRPDTPPPPPPVSSRSSTAGDRGKKPPLPPQPPIADGNTTRRRLMYDENRGSQLLPSPALPTAGSRASLQSRSPAAAAAMSRPDHRAGLLETDLDSNVTRTSSSSLMMGGGGCSPNKKARSLLDLGASSAKLSLAPNDSNRPSVDGSSSNSTDYRAKSMEFLLDKENQAAVQAPENELRKVNVNGGERILSEHELRIQRSLQRLNLPEWYKTCNVPAQGFLLKRHSDAGHTTSMSSLSSNQSQSPKMYSNCNNTLLSPQTHTATKNFSRWSTSRLNGSNSNSTSPCSSTRSSFNYRQPYLGWRSQEKLSKPRTPAERLAAGLIAQQQNEPTCQTSLSEVQSSIKEVTSAIANYVSSSTPGGSKERLNTDYQDTPSGCPSLRGSTGRLCWLESSFVGNKRPSLTRDTPPSEISTPPSHRKVTSNRQTQNNGSWVNVSGNTLTTSQNKHLNNDGLNHSGTATPFPGGPPSGSIRCRYSECQRSATIYEARRTFKMCHNCNHMYCSRRCRRAHWQNHRKTCLDRRTATLCQSIVDAIKANDRCVERLSTIARRGYLTQGRGAVKCYFSGIELADKFVRGGGGGGDDMQCEPVYAKWTDIDPELDALEQLCKTYNPDTRFVLHVSVCVQSEVPGPGPVQWERHVVYKCIKCHLDKNLRPVTTAAAAAAEPINYNKDAVGHRRRSDSTVDTVASSGGGPDTLILTSLPGYDRRDTHTARRVCFVNVQRHLRQRGVEFRQQFPDVYQKLCEYVDGDADVMFTPVTIYPRDKVSGKTFMCIIMPDTEPEKLSLLPEDSSKVQTIDISLQESTPTTVDDHSP